jgi:hypothetical protein
MNASVTDGKLISLASDNLEKLFTEMYDFRSACLLGWGHVVA